MNNPFTPSFGKVPPLMAGRDKLVSDMRRAFEAGWGNPDLSSLVVGARGTGKTTLLFHLVDIASECGWIGVSVTSLPGMLEDIYEQAVSKASHLIDERGRSRITGVGIGNSLSLSWEAPQEPQRNWRSRMSSVVEELNSQDVGLLITVDEVNPRLDEMKSLAAVYQHFVGEERKVSLLMAGLPGNISALLRDESVSFLRRASRHRLGRIGDSEIEVTLVKTIEGAGRRISSEAAEAAVDAIEGYPYMLQLTGFRMWDAHPDRDVIDSQDALFGIDLARRDFEDRVLEPTYYDLARGDRRFLESMLEDDGESALSDIAARFEKGSNYISTYKRRLVEQGIIGERGSSAVGFDLPGFKDYLSKIR